MSGYDLKDLIGNKASSLLPEEKYATVSKKMN
jgi:hypothetical protein